MVKEYELLYFEKGFTFEEYLQMPSIVVDIIREITIRRIKNRERAISNRKVSKEKLK